MSRMGTWPEPGEDEGDDEAEGETGTSAGPAHMCLPLL